MAGEQLQSGLCCQVFCFLMIACYAALAAITHCRTCSVGVPAWHRRDLGFFGRIYEALPVAGVARSGRLAASSCS